MLVHNGINLASPRRRLHRLRTSGVASLDVGWVGIAPDQVDVLLGLWVQHTQCLGDRVHHVGRDGSQALHELGV